jgi:hypothetical protein
MTLADVLGTVREIVSSSSPGLTLVINAGTGLAQSAGVGAVASFQ